MAEPDPVIVIALFCAQFFVHETLVGVSRSVEVSVLTSCTQGQDPGLVQGDVADILSLGSELQLLLVLLLVTWFGGFGHGGIIGDGDGVGSNESINAVLK